MCSRIIYLLCLSIVPHSLYMFPQTKMVCTSSFSYICPFLILLVSPKALSWYFICVTCIFVCLLLMSDKYLYLFKCFHFVLISDFCVTYKFLAHTLILFVFSILSFISAIYFFVISLVIPKYWNNLTCSILLLLIRNNFAPVSDYHNQSAAICLILICL